MEIRAHVLPDRRGQFSGEHLFKKREGLGVAQPRETPARHFDQDRGIVGKQTPYGRIFWMWTLS